VLLELKTRTKSVYVCGIDEKVTVVGAVPSVCVEIGSYVLAIYAFTPYKAKIELVFKVPEKAVTTIEVIAAVERQLKEFKLT